MTVSMEWAEKYRPKTLADVIGHKKPIEQLRDWAEGWVRGAPEFKAVILQGPAGVGKTSSAHALALDFEWELIELNASDQRTANVIEKVAGSASQMRTLTSLSGKRLIVLDEADNLHGNSDRGGSRAIINVIKETSQPIVLIANDLYGISPSLRALCLEIKFSSIQTRSIIPALKEIARKEDVMCGIGVIEKIAENAGGDFRSAVNDLQAVAVGRTEINIEDISTAERDNKESVFKVVGKIFKGRNVRSALEATYSLDETPEDLIHWIDENLPYQYTGKGEEKITTDIVDAYAYISRADRFLGRVRRRQNYRMWRYAGLLMTGGTVVSKSKIRGGFVKYQSPSLWRRMGQIRSKRNMRDNIAAKVGAHCNESMKYSRMELTSIYSTLLDDGEYAVGVVATLGLNIDELVQMKGGKKLTKKIQETYDAAQQLRPEAPSGIDFLSKFQEKAPQKRPDQLSLDSIPALDTQAGDKTMVSGKVTSDKKPGQRKPQKTLFDF
ncbi:replication factor C large subunit [Methanolobus halotolerans]|uniref:Replication factor C large subunit n=1 Tax=Methanolobus halotolerans TaxID=2052935 RepID=A0A4E0PXE6_9EURY|nr:replication factor C large subunit [Methanolobus halotolerans]TGC07879.1 replication protein C [Methanolobus halotolerans]